jgi:hypothetical protein
VRECHRQVGLYLKTFAAAKDRVAKTSRIEWDLISPTASLPYSDEQFDVVIMHTLLSDAPPLHHAFTCLHLTYIQVTCPTHHPSCPRPIAFCVPAAASSCLTRTTSAQLTRCPTPKKGVKLILSS